MTITLEHLGHWDLPRPQGADERFGFGLAALTLTPRGTMWASGKITRGLVAEITVPEPGGVAEIVTPWFDPAGGLRGELKRTKLDRLGGLLEKDDRRYSLHYTYYGTGDIDALDVPTLIRHRIVDAAVREEALWHIGPPEHPFHQKNTSHWLFESPDGRVYCGRGDGAGHANAPHGPALFRVDLENPADAEVLLYRDAEHAPSWWSPVDKWTGGAWLSVGGTERNPAMPLERGTERVAFVGSKDTTPDRWWYGTGDLPDKQPEWFVSPPGNWVDHWKASGIRDPWHSSRGYHTQHRAVVLQLYDPEKLGAGQYPEPEKLVLESFHPASWVGGMAYDHAKQRLYVGEVWPPENMEGKQSGEWPRIMVYSVSAGEDSEQPVRATISVRATYNGRNFIGALEEE